MQYGYEFKFLSSQMFNANCTLVLETLAFVIRGYQEEIIQKHLKSRQKLPTYHQVEPEDAGVSVWRWAKC